MKRIHLFNIIFSKGKLVSRWVIPSIFACLLFVTACNDKLDTPAEDKKFTGGTDYTLSENMIQSCIGLYYTLYNGRGWEDIPLVSVRGDDVNAGGKGDQPAYGDTDWFKYTPDFWMTGSVWSNDYKSIFIANAAIEEFNKYREAGADGATADQYVAEAKVVRAFLYFQLSRVFGGLFLPETSQQESLYNEPLRSKDEVMQYLSDQMDEAIPYLPDMHPRDRQDLPGGVTKYTAYAIKALANLELKKYQEVANATGEIIKSNKFELEPDFYQLFKVIKGKLNKESLLEFQFSDYGTGSGTQSYLGAFCQFYGPQGWTPAVSGAGGGWGFYEPSQKWIKFMIDRGDDIRLETSVLFTNQGVDSLKKVYPSLAIPTWITDKLVTVATNVSKSGKAYQTREGDKINDHARAIYWSGKHYLPSTQLTTGRTGYGTNKNYLCIRYAEILLMYAEAITQNATASTTMTADQAVNLVRLRAGLNEITGVTNAQVMDEKFAELAMEWGIRFYDMVRLGKYDELSYEGRTFTEDLIFMPYPQAQVDILPQLRVKQ